MRRHCIEIVGALCQGILQVGQTDLSDCGLSRMSAGADKNV
jgi:hypothetical protein